MKVLLAPDKFRGSLTAPEAAAAFARGVRSAAPGADVVVLPVADGGEGTVDAFVGAGWEPVTLTCSGPTGAPVDARYARLGERAVVELAECCGMQRLPDGVAAPREATSRGAGEAVAAALRAGAREVVLGVGGSASTDGGLGLLDALGVVVRSARGALLPAVPRSLHDAAAADVSGVLPELNGARLVVATDVSNPLTGPDGAAAVFGPQKGATAGDVAWLAAGLGRWADLLRASSGLDVASLPGGGAAGGVPAGLVGALGGVAEVSIVSGADTVVELVGIPAALAGCDLVLIGEGSFDRQSLAGKGPARVAAAAAAAGVPVGVVAGRVAVGADALRSAGVGAWRSLTDLAHGSALNPMRDAAELAARGAAEVTAELLSPA